MTTATPVGDSARLAPALPPPDRSDRTRIVGTSRRRARPLDRIPRPHVIKRASRGGEAPAASGPLPLRRGRGLRTRRGGRGARPGGARGAPRPRACLTWDPTPQS
ncbi:hypothetical protein QJS66_06585 [Kocuria rhizophila]|nr:hypothetical protein QJS66_06585 [Kocuria rhizophila]